MVRALKWLGIVTAGLLALLLLAALALPSLVNLERYRSLLTSRVSRALGREVRLQSLQVSLWRGLGAEARGIQVAEAPGFGAEPFLSAEAVRVQVKLWPLLQGQLRVTSVVLERPRVRLLHGVDGRWSVEDLFRPQPAASAPRPQPEPLRPGKAPLFGGLLLNEIAVQDGEIALLERSGAPSATLTLRGLDLTVRQGGLSEPALAQVRGTLGGALTGRVEVTARVQPEHDGLRLEGSLALRDVEWKAESPLPGGLSLTGPTSGEVRFSGPLARLALSGQLDLKAAAVGVGTWLRKGAGEPATLRFEGRREEPGVRVEKAALAFRDMSLEVSGRIPDLKAPRVTFAASVPKLDLDRLLMPPPQRAGIGPAAVWAAAPPPPPRHPAGLPVQGRVRIGELLYRGLVWQQVEADLTYQDGLLRVPVFQGGFLGGALRGSGEADLRAKAPQLSLAFALTGAATEPLVRALNPGAWTLKSGLEVEGRFQVATLALADLLGSVRGEGSLRLTDGRLTDYRPLDRLADVVTPVLAAQGVRVRLNEFQQIRGHYSLENGFLRTRDLTLTKAEGTGTAVGALGLLDSSLNFDVALQFGRTAAEAKVTGTTRQPIVVPKLVRLQRQLERELDKLVPEGQGKGLKELFRGLFGR